MRWLARGLLLDWCLGSQKLREILTPLYCITLSSSRENQHSAQEVASYKTLRLEAQHEGLARSLLLDWYFGSQKLREILTLLCCITLSSSTEKPTQCSRGSKKDFWHRCRGDLRTSQYIPSTHHKLLSLALHYLPFASRFPLPHFTLAVLFALSFPSPLFRLPLVCSCVGLLACHDGSRQY